MTMNASNLNKLTLTCVALLCAVVAFGQQSDSLMTYVQHALKNNPTVLQKYSEYEAALEKVPQVGSLPDPQLEMGVFLSPMELVGGNQVADIKLMQMFPWFGVIRNAKDEMSLMAKAKFETFRDAKLQVCYEVQQTWFDLYKVRQKIRISEENVTLLKTVERLTLVKFRSGSSGGSASSSGGSMLGGTSVAGTTSSSGMNSMGGNSGSTTSSRPETPSGTPSMGSSASASSLSDVYLVQIESGNLEDQIATLHNEEQVLRARFNSLLNRPQTTSVFVPDSLPVEPLAKAYLMVSDSMFSQNPMLGMLQYERQSLEARNKMVKKMGYPMVGLGLNYSVISKSGMSTSAMNGQDMVMPMVTLSLPIYRKKYNAMQKEVSILKTASEHNYQATTNALQVEYYEALQLYNDAQRRMTLYQNQSQLAQRSLNIMIKTFSSSNSNLTDILRIRQQLFDYELRLVEAVADSNKAKAWVKRLANTI